MILCGVSLVLYGSSKPDSSADDLDKKDESVPPRHTAASKKSRARVDDYNGKKGDVRYFFDLT
eukprot:scaffold9012_cov34-Prasinocladus_malaysianus.AAC.1